MSLQFFGQIFTPEVISWSISKRRDLGGLGRSSGRHQPASHSTDGVQQLCFFAVIKSKNKRKSKWHQKQKETQKQKASSSIPQGMVVQSFFFVAKSKSKFNFSANSSLQPLTPRQVEVENVHSLKLKQLRACWQKQFSYNQRDDFQSYMEKSRVSGDNISANFLDFPPNFRLRTRYLGHFRPF